MDGSGDNRFFDIFDQGVSWAVIGLDSVQVIEGYVETVLVDFYLVGYITDNATFFLNGVDYSLGAGFGVWTDIDLTPSVTSFTTHVIFEVDGGIGQDYGFRRNGSTETIVEAGEDHFFVKTSIMYVHP